MQYGGGFDEWLLDCKVFDEISDPDDADKKEEYDRYLRVSRGLKELFDPLMRELKKSRTAQARLYPEMFAVFRAQFDDWKAEVKLHSYLNMDEERQVVEGAPYRVLFRGQRERLLKLHRTHCRLPRMLSVRRARARSPGQWPRRRRVGRDRREGGPPPRRGRARSVAAASRSRV